MEVPSREKSSVMMASSRLLSALMQDSRAGDDEGRITEEACGREGAAMVDGEFYFLSGVSGGR